MYTRPLRNVTMKFVARFIRELFGSVCSRPTVRVTSCRSSDSRRRTDDLGQTIKPLFHVKI